MKQITMYEANDGSKYAHSLDAIKRDGLLLEIKEIEDLLPPNPIDKGCRFANGEGYLSVDKDNFESAKRMLIALAETETGQEFNGNLRGMMGRYLDDGRSPLYRVLLRLECVDSQYRMWGQPYFANNPTTGIQQQFKEQ